MTNAKSANRVKTWWVVSAVVVIIGLAAIIAPVLMFIVWVKGDEPSFSSINEERQDIESSITELATELNIDTTDLEATQRPCAGGIIDGDKERVDFHLVAEGKPTPDTTTWIKVEHLLNSRGWQTERSTSATSNDIFATRAGASLDVTIFYGSTVNISGSTDCYN